MTQEPDYVTVNPAAILGKFCVVVMRHEPRDDEYVIWRISQAMQEAAARSLANSWAAALGVEIR